MNYCSVGGFLDSSLLLFESLRLLCSPEAESQLGSVEFIESRGTLVAKCKLLARDVMWIISLERLDSTADVKCEFLVRQVAELNARVLDLESNDFQDLAARVAKLEMMNDPNKHVQSSNPNELQAVTEAKETTSQDRKTVSKNTRKCSALQKLFFELTERPEPPRLVLDF